MLAIAALFVADVVVTQAIFTSKVPGANDYFSRWMGARSFFVLGLDPYSDEATRLTQMGMYGRLAVGAEDPAPYLFPFYAVFISWPLVNLPYAWVQAIWMCLLEFTIIAAALMSTALMRWRMTPLRFALMLLFALFFYNSTRAILLGQHAIIVAALVIGSFLAIRNRRDTLAGVMLAWSTVKPQMVFLIIPYVMLWALARRRWRLIISAAVSMAILTGISFILVPTWLNSFLSQLGYYTTFTFIGSPVWVIMQYYLGLGDAGEWIVSGAIGLALLVVWARTLRDDRWSTFLWVSGLTLIVTNLIALRTATTNYVILFIGLWMAARVVADRWPERARWIVPLGALSWVVGSWVLFLSTLVGKEEHPLVYLPLPFALAAAFVLWRKEMMGRVDA
jgi:hypothetical protein